MTDSTPDSHPLQDLFHGALKQAFREFKELYSPDIAEHIGDNVLGDFVHVDRIYRLTSLEGERLEDVREMVQTAHENEGPERRLEVDRYIGDFVLFMGGFFPNVLGRSRWTGGAPMVARVGKVLVNFEKPMDYYLAEGRNAYSRAAATAELFDPTSHSMLSRLGANIEGYLDVVSLVKRLIRDDPDVRKVSGILEG